MRSGQCLLRTLDCGSRLPSTTVGTVFYRSLPQSILRMSRVHVSVLFLTSHIHALSPALAAFLFSLFSSSLL